MRDEAMVKPWSVVERELAALLARVDPAQFETLARTLESKAGRLFFSGQGRSGLVAQMAAMRFMHAGCTVHVVGEVTAPAIRKGDTLVLVCGSGKTPVSVSFSAVARQEGATLALVTHKPESPLAQAADLLLTVPMYASVQFGGSVFEQACLVLFDALALRRGSGPEAQAAMWRRHTNLQ